MSQNTAESVYRNFTRLSSTERVRFFTMLAEPSVQGDNFSHGQVFGHLAGEKFTAAESAEYLGVSMSTFRRYVGHGRIRATSAMGRNQLFATKDLKAFKRLLQEVKARSAPLAA